MAGSQENRQNRAAAWTAGLLGVVLVAVSAPFTIALWEEEPAPWDVAWDQAPYGATASGSLDNAGDTVTAWFNFTDASPASIEVATRCSDAPAAGQQPAQVELVLYEGDAEVARTQGTCTELASEPWNVTFEHPDIGGVQGINQVAAQERVDDRAAAENRTASYRVVASSSRSGTIPIPIPGLEGTFAAEFTVTGSAWLATAVARAPEVLR